MAYLLVAQLLGASYQKWGGGGGERRVSCTDAIVANNFVSDCVCSVVKLA